MSDENVRVVREIYDRVDRLRDELSFEPEEFIVAGDAVIVSARSGDDLAFHVFHFEGDLVARVDEVRDREQALALAGRGRELDYS